MLRTNHYSVGASQTAAVEKLFRDATALHRRGKLEEAVRAYSAILLANPKHFDALHLSGVARAQQGQLAEAVSLLRQAIACGPHSAQAHNNLGMTLNLANRHRDAVPVLEQAISLNPRDAIARNNLGVALQALARYNEATACFEQAAAMNPRYVEALSNLSAIYRQDGSFVDARRNYEAALAIEPENIDLLCALLQTETLSADDPHFTALAAAGERVATLPTEQRIKVHFALGKAYAEIGQHDRSFRHLIDGNALKRSLIAYDEADRLRSFDRIGQVFSADLMQSRANFGSPSQRPVFILGMMRSGSTLVEQILASHPDVFAVGEQSEFNASYRAIVDSLKSTTIYPDIVPFLSSEQLRELGDEYLRRLDDLTFAGAAVSRITDKMLGNFTAIGLIHLALPNARIIHTLRNPIDTCLSCYSLLFVDEHPYAYDLGELGRYYRGYTKLMQHWHNVLPAGTILDVRYEELVGDFETQVHRILDYCGLKWNDACLSFYKTNRPVRTASQAQVRRPIYQSSVGRWRPEAQLLRPLLEGLGDDIDNTVRGQNARVGER